jgi:hypothetical protein
MRNKKDNVVRLVVDNVGNDAANKLLKNGTAVIKVHTVKDILRTALEQAEKDKAELREFLKSVPCTTPQCTKAEACWFCRGKEALLAEGGSDDS